MRQATINKVTDLITLYLTLHGVKIEQSERDWKVQGKHQTYPSRLDAVLDGCELLIRSELKTS